MESQDTKHFPWNKSLAGLMLALCLYVGLYFCLVKPVKEPWYNVDAGIATQGYVPSYRIGGGTAAVIFQPLQMLDQYLFPDRWKKEWEEKRVMVNQNTEGS